MGVGGSVRPTRRLTTASPSVLRPALLTPTCASLLRHAGLVREGCDLALCDIDEAALAAVAEECRAVRSGANVSVHKVDMASRDEIRRFAAEVK